MREEKPPKMTQELHDELIFVGYTNGYQILYANDAIEGEGSFYSNTDGDSIIPLYMLKTHYHRLESTTNGNVTLDRIIKARK